MHSKAIYSSFYGQLLLSLCICMTYYIMCSSKIYQSSSMTSKCCYIARAIIIRESILSLANLTSPQNHK